MAEPVNGQYENGNWMLECGCLHVSAPYTLHINESGILHAGPIPIASSVTKWLLSEAVADEMLTLQPRWVTTAYIHFPRRPDRFDFSRHIPQIDEACDDYHTWWGNDRVRIEQGVFWGQEPQDFVRLYARTERELNLAMDWFRLNCSQMAKSCCTGRIGDT